MQRHRANVSSGNSGDAVFLGEGSHEQTFARVPDIAPREDRARQREGICMAREPDPARERRADRGPRDLASAMAPFQRAEPPPESMDAPAPHAQLAAGTMNVAEHVVRRGGAPEWASAEHHRLGLDRASSVVRNGPRGPRDAARLGPDRVALPLAGELSPETRAPSVRTERRRPQVGRVRPFAFVARTALGRRRAA